jgi:hypothetical protein
MKKPIMVMPLQELASELYYLWSLDILPYESQILLLLVATITFYLFSLRSNIHLNLLQIT